MRSFVVLFLSCVVCWCSCRVFVCDLFLFLPYRASYPISAEFPHATASDAADARRASEGGGRGTPGGGGGGGGALWATHYARGTEVDKENAAAGERYAPAVPVGGVRKSVGGRRDPSPLPGGSLQTRVSPSAKPRQSPAGITSGGPPSGIARSGAGRPPSGITPPVARSASEQRRKSILRVVPSRYASPQVRSVSAAPVSSSSKFMR